MPLARVWNDNDKPYSEKFEDNLITIPAKGYVEMDKADAIKFVSAWIPIKRLDDGTPLNPKMLRTEFMPEKPVEKILCQMCKEEFQTNKELSLHSELKHAEDMVDENARKDVRKRQSA